MREGDKLDLEIMHVTSDGRGVAKGKNNEVIFIEGISDTDDYVRAIVTKVFQCTVFAEKITKVQKTSEAKTSAKTGEEGPYSLDDG